MLSILTLLNPLLKNGPKEESVPQKPKLVLSDTSLFKRELKLQGQIGIPTQRNKCLKSFVSLTNQIDNVVEKGYSHTEMMEAVTRAIVPGMDDSAKKGRYPTSELFTVILCDPNFAVS